MREVAFPNLLRHVCNTFEGWETMLLLRFGVKNYRSMREKQELSFVAADLDDIDAGLMTTNVVSDIKVLPAAVIYGANASGKSTLISALEWMRSAVLGSHIHGDPRRPVPTVAFRLDRNSQPSEFEIDFIQGDARYQYGFTILNKRYDQEWLHMRLNGKDHLLFERRQNSSFSFGPRLGGHNRVIEDLTRPNSLFLSAAAQNGHKRLSPISDFFRSIWIDNSSSESGIHAVAQEGVDGRVIAFLGAIEAGVVDYQTKLIPGNKEFRSDFNALLSKHFRGVDFESMVREDFYSVKFGHSASTQKVVYLDFSDESSGTKRLIILLQNVFRTIDKGGVVVSDEFTANLHTKACEAILQLFSDRVRNSGCGQLLATTHDTNLLRSPFIRRDQVWFTEKDRFGATTLYPLSDIESKQHDDLEKGYLQGRYGAVPYSGSIQGLFALKH